MDLSALVIDNRGKHKLTSRIIRQSQPDVKDLTFTAGKRLKSRFWQEDPDRVSLFAGYPRSREFRDLGVLPDAPGLAMSEIAAETPDVIQSMALQQPQVSKFARPGAPPSFQHASESRVIFNPFRLPSTVTAINSGWNNSFAERSRSSTVTAWMRLMISSMPMKWS
jgi:hypothetical protein